VALAALGTVGLVTAAWWVLALYPAAAAPEWMIRTRYVCFGAPPGGLPNAGGWILLVGQPLGMLVMLFAGWGDALRRDLRVFAERAHGKLVLGLVAGAALWGAVSAVSIVRSATQSLDRFSINDSAPAPRSFVVPPLLLTDQHGRQFELRSLADGPALVAFAFAHCETMCPTAIRELLRMRAESDRDDIPLVVVTVDPWRDVPSRLATVAGAWHLSSKDRVLSGGVDDVNAALDAWGIIRQRDETTGDVVHPVAVVLVHPGGRKATRFDGSFEGLRGMLTGL
jgi:cytochrome oxidase Cu insertion factor (SCO1/SenC/PrrC family)